MFSQYVLCVSLFAALFSTATSQVTIDDFPYKVILQNVAINNIICAGALIEDDIVITAGECINKFKNKEDIKILASVMNIHNPVWNYERNIAKITLHTNYIPGSVKENIALIKLDAPIPIGTNNVATVELSEEEVTIGRYCHISKSTSDAFKMYNVKVEEKELCGNNLADFVDEYLICTGWNAEYALQTDLGGPLVCNGILQGLAINDLWVPSYGQYGAFLSIATVKDWIELNKFEGRFVNEDEYPFMVQIVDKIVREKDSLNYICTGVLINENTVLTTAECADPTATDYVAVVGSTRKQKYQDPYYINKENIVAATRHEKYDADTKEFNIGLLTLENPFPGAKFPSLKRIKSERICQAVGWGPQSTSAYAFNENGLQTVDLKLEDLDYCSTQYPTLSKESILCSGDVKEKRNFCQNDLGGPLFCDNVLRGLYSSGDSCSKGPKYPAIYTDVADYIEWIEGQNSSGRLGASLLCIFIALFNIFS